MPQQQKHIAEEEMLALLEAGGLTAREKLETLSDAEAGILTDWLQHHPDHANWKNEILDADRFAQLFAQYKPLQDATAGEWEKFRQAYLSSTATKSLTKGSALLRKWCWVAAAVLILVIASGVYYFNTQPPKNIGGTVGTSGDIAPGGNKAIWTLADGKKIELDSTILDMTAKSQSLETNGYNELSTPRGGQYQLILPDGSKVWLNAASSIKYPVEFSGKERRVEINGEVYFEIAKDATKPFRVSAGEQEIEVLGTSFNVNAYSDEPIIKTTLLTGSIKLTNNNQTVILKPNQQAQIINSSLLIINSSSDVLAWKNGLFSFTGKNLETIMREIARWYNIEILYPNGVPDLEILGGAQRNVSLQKLLTFFKESDLHFTMQGDNILIVTK